MVVLQATGKPVYNEMSGRLECLAAATGLQQADVLTAAPRPPGEHEGILPPLLADLYPRLLVALPLTQATFGGMRPSAYSCNIIAAHQKCWV